jgi:hypothetical protein
MIDKLNFVQNIILNAAKTGMLLNPKEIFDFVDEFEKEAIDRGLVHLTHCPKCGVSPKSIDLQGQFRVQCNCYKSIEQTKEKAFEKWTREVLGDEKK